MSRSREGADAVLQGDAVSDADLFSLHDQKT